jgi:DNA-binding transcriptional LysR family regulator
MQLKDIDLNLLLVFHELLVEKRVSKVAQKLGMTQPGISNALKRLRVLLGDELFLRTARGMEPTPYAASLAVSIGQALEVIRSTLNQKPNFEPETNEHRFMVRMTDIGEIYLLPRLMDHLAKQSPKITISTVRDVGLNLQEQMELGQIDLAIGLLPHLKTGFFQRKLFHQRYVCMFRKGHPLDGDSMSLAKFKNAEHVVVVSEGTGHLQVDETIEKQGIKRNVKLMVPHFVALGHILSATDLIATVPEKYAKECLEPFGLKYVKHPVQLPEIDINIFWHAKFNKDPANQWLRNQFVEIFSD